MPSKARMYGRVLQEVLEKTPESKQKALFKRFKELLKKRGDLRLLSGAVQEFQGAWENRKGNIAQVIFAKAPSAAMRQSTEKALKRKGFAYQEKLDSSLIGGAKIFLGNELLIDNSIRGKLRTLWQKNISTKF